MFWLMETSANLNLWSRMFFKVVFIFYTADMWNDLETKIISFVDETTLCGIDLDICSFLNLLELTINDKLTFEKHIRNIAFYIAQKTGLIRKCYKFFSWLDITHITCFICFTILLWNSLPNWVVLATKRDRFIVLSKMYLCD